MREQGIDNIKPREEQWIRRVFYFEDEIENYFLIVCCTLKQAQALIKAQALEMDLSFKMVHGKINLFSISGWDDDSRRRLCICSTYIKLGVS